MHEAQAIVRTAWDVIHEVPHAREDRTHRQACVCPESACAAIIIRRGCHEVRHDFDETTASHLTRMADVSCSATNRAFLLQSFSRQQVARLSKVVRQFAGRQTIREDRVKLGAYFGHHSRRSAKRCGSQGWELRRAPTAM